MLQDGDVISLDYDLYVEGQERVYDTTQKETAEKQGVLEPEARYAPLSYLVGAGRLIQGLENALRKADIGKTFTLDLPPEEAYGPRDPKLIETIPLQEFRKNKVDPEAGMVIQYRNRRGVVQFVGGGRIRVDFNHALAGKTLKYTVTVRSVAKTPLEKVRGIIQMNFPTDLQWNLEVHDGAAAIHVPDEVKFDQNWLLAKLRILSDLRRLPELTTCRFVESYPLKEKEKTAAPPAPA